MAPKQAKVSEALASYDRGVDYERPHRYLVLLLPAGFARQFKVVGYAKIKKHVFPAKAGIQAGMRWRAAWTPAFAGPTFRRCANTAGRRESRPAAESRLGTDHIPW